MSFKNPTKGQIARSATSENIDFYNRKYHSLSKAMFVQLFNRKSTLDDAPEILRIFEENYSTEAKEEVLAKRNRKAMRAFYTFCIPLHVDVRKAVERFLPLEQVKEYPYSYIMENHLWDAFMDFATSNQDSMKHVKKIEVVKKDINEVFESLEEFSGW